GDLLERAGDLDGALGAYAESFQLDPASRTCFTAYERVCYRREKWRQALELYETAIQLVEGQRSRAYRLADLYARRGQLQLQYLAQTGEAAASYLRVLELDHERTRDWDKMVGVLTTRLSLTSGGDEAIGLYLRIAHMCEEGLHDADRAIDAYRKILDIAPSHKEAIESLGRLYEGTEKWADLVEITRRQIRIVNDRAQKALLYFKCGSVMESKFAKEDDAIRYYDAAIKTSPSCLPAVHGLRDLYLRRQDWPRVTQTLELEAKLWTEDKERAGIYAHIGQIYRDKLRDTSRAIQYYESALQVDKE